MATVGVWLGAKEEPLLLLLLLHGLLKVQEVSQKAANGDLKARAFDSLRDFYETQSRSETQTRTEATLFGRFRPARQQLKAIRARQTRRKLS